MEALIPRAIKREVITNLPRPHVTTSDNSRGTGSLRWCDLLTGFPVGGNSSSQILIIEMDCRCLLYTQLTEHTGKSSIDVLVCPNNHDKETI